MTRVEFSSAQYPEQRAFELMQALHDYAVSLGCETFQDEIIVRTAEQERLLAKWWKEHT